MAEKHGRLDIDSGGCSLAEAAADDKKSGGGSTGGLSHLEKQGLEATPEIEFRLTPEITYLG